MSGRWKAYVTREIPAGALHLLRGELGVEVNPEDRALSKDELLKRVKGIDALLCLLDDTVDDEVLAAGERLKIVANYAVG